MSVTAAVVNAVGSPFELTELELDGLRPDEVLVDIAAAGICHTDLTARAGGFPTPFPVVLGHEGAGTVAAVGSDITDLVDGDRVALSYASCGACPTCAHGRPSYCGEFLPRNFFAARADGSTALSREGAAVHSHFFGQSAFATQAVVGRRSVVKVADDIPFEVLAPFGCGVQTGAGAVLNVLAPAPGASIAIFGAGGVGISALLAARLSGCTTIVAVDVNSGRLALATELGATDVVDAAAVDAVAAVQEATGGGAAYAVEATGVPAVLRQAVDVLAPGGTCAVVGAPPFGVTAELDVNGLIAFGRTVRGVVEGDSVLPVFVPQLVDLWRARHLPVERIVKTYDFDQINEAAHDAESGAVVKPVLRIR
jgi:aryl-alcohol dehydrogenase